MDHETSNCVHPPLIISPDCKGKMPFHSIPSSSILSPFLLEVLHDRTGGKREGIFGRGRLVSSFPLATFCLCLLDVVCAFFYRILGGREKKNVSRMPVIMHGEGMVITWEMTWVGEGREVRYRRRHGWGKGREMRLDGRGGFLVVVRMRSRCEMEVGL